MTSQDDAKIDLAEIVRRLRKLEDERAIQRTLYSYGHCYDYNDHYGWVNCFTEDADYKVMTADGQTFIACRGQVELDEWIRGHPHPAARWTQHLLIEPMITVDGDRATSVAYFVRTDELGEIPYISATGRYHDELARGADGAWRFRSRRAELETVLAGPPSFLTAARPL